jgi:hypothetical protein
VYHNRSTNRNIEKIAGQRISSRFEKGLSNFRFTDDRLKMSDQELKEKSIFYRELTLKIITAANAGHTGGDLSA